MKLGVKQPIPIFSDSTAKVDIFVELPLFVSFAPLVEYLIVRLPTFCKLNDPALLWSHYFSILSHFKVF